MKKSILFLSSLLIVALFQITLTSNKAGISGVAATGCGGTGGSGCHQEDLSKPRSSISITVDGSAPGAYIPGTLHKIVVNLTNSVLASKPAGFNMKFSNGKISNNPSGTMVMADSEIHHSPADVTSASGFVQWSFDWTAPAAGAGPINIFLSGNVANGVGGADLGDQHVSFSTTLTSGSATGKPTIVGLKAVSITNSGAVLRDTLSANGSTTTDTFEYGITTSYGTILKPTPATIVGTTTAARSVNLTGLLANKTYYYRVRASNNSGQTISAGDSFKTSLAPATNAPVITGVGHSNLTNTSAKISATINAKGNLTTPIQVLYGTSTDYSDTISTSPSLATGTSNTSVSVTLSGLAKGTLYHYQVRAVNSVGETTSNDITFTTTNIAGIASLVSKEFGVYPNPSTDFLYISADVKNIVEVEAISLSGKSIPLEAQTLATDHVKASTKSLSTGVYYIRVKTKEGWIQNSKAVRIE